MSLPSLEEIDRYLSLTELVSDGKGAGNGRNPYLLKRGN